MEFCVNQSDQHKRPGTEEWIVWFEWLEDWGWEIKLLSNNYNESNNKNHCLVGDNTIDMMAEGQSEVTQDKRTQLLCSDDSSTLTDSSTAPIPWLLNMLLQLWQCWYNQMHGLYTKCCAYEWAWCIWLTYEWLYLNSWMPDQKGFKHGNCNCNIVSALKST